MSTSDTDDKVDVLDYSNVAPVIRTTLRLQTLGLLSNALLFVDCLLATNPLQKVFNQYPNTRLSVQDLNLPAHVSLYTSQASQYKFSPVDDPTVTLNVFSFPVKKNLDY